MLGPRFAIGHEKLQLMLVVACECTRSTVLNRKKRTTDVTVTCSAQQHLHPEQIVRGLNQDAFQQKQLSACVTAKEMNAMEARA